MIKPVILGATTSLVLLVISSVQGLAQETLETGIRATTGAATSRSSEVLFKRDVDQAIPQVAEIFADSDATLEEAIELSTQLDRIGIGQNSPVSITLCAIGNIEVVTRRENLEAIKFHIDKVQSLLSTTQVAKGSQIGAALNQTFDSNPDAVYLYMHSAMAVRGCVPAEFLRVVQEAEEVRLETVDRIR
ncbi:MAG: hypothetical protein HC921_17615 [Synechococcaceae cyanobacterium SM2_3_1]|nr:hypothetical protein [Synechococcaceae cyanobacterium SM2_3_1]